MIFNMFERGDHSTSDRELEIPPHPQSLAPQSFAAEIWGFTSASGGAGVTTLCVQIAYMLSKRPEVQNRVCLVDLDFESGMVANYMDKRPNANLTHIGPNSSEIDESLAASLMTPYSATLDILAFAPELNGNAKVDPNKVLTLLDTISSMYDFIILDIPKLWAPWTHAAVGASDRFFILSELSVPNLIATRVRFDGIKSMAGLEHVSPNVIINKHERRSFRNSLKLSDAESALQSQIFGSICVQTDVLREAMNRGEPVGVRNSDSRYVKDVAHLMNMISTHSNIKSHFAKSA